jgi:hypothetical protein
MTHPHEVLTNAPAFDPALGVFVPAGTPPEAFGDAAEDTGLRPDVKFETRLEALQRENRERAGQREADMVEADTKGQLWTVQAAMYPGRVFCLVYLGRHDDTEPLESQHRSASAIFGPLHLIGKTHREAMFEVMKLFTVDEITIRTVR